MRIERKQLGNAIKRYREVVKVTQKTLAEKTGKTVNYISLLETGKRFPSFETLNDIGEALGIPAALIVVLGSPQKD